MVANVLFDREIRGARFNRFKERVLHGPKQLAMKTFASSPTLASLYFAFVNGGFGREHKAVLAGMRAYADLEGRGAANRFYLRRNTHRLEKGLIMKPRRDIFALGYIEGTVEAYGVALEAWQEGRFDAEELQWSHDVLKEYFSVVAAHPLLEQLRERFEALPALDRTEETYIPYYRQLDGKPPVDYASFFKLARQRRSVRWYQDKPVPRELVDKALVAALEAPSACNRQPFQFRIFDDPEKVRELITIPGGTKGFAGNVPMVCVLVGQLRAYWRPRNRHLIYIDAALAAMGFMLALETLGLSSCPINWPDIESRERLLAEKLDLDPDQRAIMFIAVGYPDPEGAVAYSKKQPLDRLRTYNE